MPILVLLPIALVFGLLVALAFHRFAPARGATAAAADAVEEMAESAGLRGWWRMRTDPELATGLALTAAVGLLIVGGLVIGVLALLVRGNSTMHSVDSSAADWGDAHATHTATRILTWITDFGDWPLVPLIAVPILIYEYRRSPNRYLLPFFVVVLGGDQLVTTGVKDLIDRARPTLNPVAATLGPSFPSGHSSTAASFYAALALILARGRSARTRALLAGAAAAIAVAVAESRVLLDLHWVSDVIAGVMLGWAWFALCAIAFGGRRVHYAEPIQRAAAEATAAAEPAAPATRTTAKV
jgi:membrane-associated phospholipid phosphatase